jgi:hypothetical protein
LKSEQEDPPSSTAFLAVSPSFFVLGKSDRGCTDNCSKGRGSTLTQYLTWFGKTAYIHGRVIVLEIEKGLQYIHVEEEDYIHSTQLIFAALAAAAMAARLLPLQPLFLS